MITELLTEYNKTQGGNSSNLVVTQGGVWTITASAVGFPATFPPVTYNLNDVVGNGDNPEVNFSGVTAGNYSFTYTLTSASGCTDSAILVVTVANTPSVNTTNMSYCSASSGAVNFSSRLSSGSSAGTFNLVSAPNNHSTDVSFSLPKFINFTGEPTGFYEYIYTVANGSCTASDTVSIEIVGEVLQDAKLDLCNANVIVTMLDELPDDYTEPTHGLGAQQVSGVWTIVSGVPGAAFNAAAGQFNPFLAANGTYVFRYTYQLISKYLLNTCNRTADLTIVVDNAGGTNYPNQVGNVCVN